MTGDPWFEEFEVSPFEYLNGLLTNAADVLRDVAAKSGNITSNDELSGMITQLRDLVVPALIDAETSMVALLFEDRPAA